MLCNVDHINKIVSINLNGKVFKGRVYIQENYSSYGLDTNGDMNVFSGTGSVTGSSSGASYTVDTSTSGTVGTTLITSGYGSSECRNFSKRHTCC